MAEPIYQTIRVEPDNGVVRIVLDRPDRRNAISRQVQTELIDAVERAGRDPQAGAVIISGEGSSFCSGYDVSGDGATHSAAPPSVPRRAVETIEMARGWSRAAWCRRSCCATWRRRTAPKAARP